MALREVLAVVIGLASFGCGASSEHYDDRDWTKDHGIQTGAWREVETLFGADESDADRFKAELRGVRHDLSFADKATPDTRCHCLDVVIGRPAEKKFAWADRKPTISDEHMAVAIRTDGSRCSLPAGTARRPSIQAVDIVGKDVVIVIEELPYDRPQALGAVIRKPHPEGHLYIRPRSYKNRVLPYARGVHGADRCLVKTDPNEHHLQFHAGRRF